MKINDYFINIPYEDLKKAVEEIEKKINICDFLPCGRFRFDFIKTWPDKDYINFGRISNTDGSNIRFELISCDEEKMGGKNTGTAAKHCINYIRRKYKLDGE